MILYHQNLKACPQKLKETAYISLVRSILEYGATVWDPHLSKDIYALERVQRRAARFIKHDYSRESSVTGMLQELGLKTLEHRRRDLRLALLYKLTHEQVNVSTDELCISRPVRNNRSNHIHKHQHPAATTTELRQSFVNRTIPEWNALPAAASEAPTLDSFKAQLPKLPSAGHSD